MGRKADENAESDDLWKMKVTGGTFCPCMKCSHNQQFTILFAKAHEAEKVIQRIK